MKRRTMVLRCVAISFLVIAPGCVGLQSIDREHVTRDRAMHARFGPLIDKLEAAYPDDPDDPSTPSFRLLHNAWGEHVKSAEQNLDSQGK